MLLMQVFAVGIKEAVTSTKFIVGCKANPNTGSSSAPVTNCNTLLSITALRLPPTCTKRGDANKRLDFDKIFI